MNLIAVVFIGAVSIYVTISWLIPQLLAWHFKRKYKVELKVGRIVLPKFILKDVTIAKNGYTVHIEEISIKSSLFNSEVTKLISVVIRDVRINKDVVEEMGSAPGMGPRLKPLLTPKHSDGASQGVIEDTNKQLEAEVKKLVDFRDMQIPSGVMLFAQFLSVKVHNLSVMVLGDGGSGGWLWHCMMTKGGAGGGAGGGPGLHLGLVAHEVRAKLLRRHPHTHPSHQQQTCLAEISFSLNLDLSLLGDNTLNVEKLSCSISNPSATLNEGIYKFVYDQSNKKKLKTKSSGGVVQRNPTGNDSLFQRLAPIIPKNFTLKVNTTTVTGVRNNSRTDFCSSLQSLQINARFSASHPNSMDDLTIGLQNGASEPKLPQVYLAFQMDQFKINSNKEKLMFLSKLKLDAKLEREVLNLYLIVNTLTLSYIHDDVFKWCCSSFPLKDLDLVSDSMHVDTKPVEVENNVPSWLEDVCGACIIQGCAELWGLTLGVQRGGHHATLACSGLKVKLDQLTDLRSAPYKATFSRLILGMRHWSTELLVDSAWLQVGAGDTPLKRHHSWGTGLFVGVALLKWGSHAHQTTKLEAMLDCLRAEWGPNVARTLLLLLDCYTDYRKYKSAIQLKPRTEISENKMSVTMTLTNVNMFTLAENDICIMTRIDAISVEKTSKMNLVISGFKMADVVPFKGNFICQRAEEMATMFFYVKLMRYELQNRVSDVQLLEVVEGQWSPNLHLKCLTIIKDLRRFKDDFKNVFKSKAVKNEVDNAEREDKQWCVTFKGDVAVRLILSQKHNLSFTFDELTLSNGLAGLSLCWGFGHLAIDDVEIFSVEGVTFDRIQDSPKIREERQNADGFTLPWNKTWGVTIVSFRTAFPYQHNFSEAIQDELVSITKWIKLIHNYKKKEFTANSPLPSDLYIKVEEFILELSDDPFEVKLRDNYELLEDEYKESLKRKTMLDAKVAEVCKPHLFLPAGKVEELYAGLSRRNAQIYVQRSKQLAAGANPRPLLSCRLLNTRILALADPTLHGTQRCISHLKQLDPESSWGEEVMEFSTLWCRWVVGWCEEWRLQLRDFPQPLLRATDLQFWGKFMGAEQVPPPRARRLSGVDQGTPWGIMQIERSMTSLKFYHDLNCDMDHFTYAFGPCWEPVIAQCNISWDQVLRGSRDPSAPLPWWDKVRLVLHGRLTLCVRRLALLLHASLDPYNTTEEMELAWTDLALDWTNAKIVFKGDLNVYVRTASKYDDCCLLHLPNLRLTLKLTWLCLADPNDHHSVVQCAPDKIPEYSSNQEHDSFRAFRSQNVDVHLALETKPSDDCDCPVLLLYGSTLRWIESLKQILSGATRPTRRGALFNNTKPRRPQLSRHIRTARLSLALHRFQVCYWMSFAMQRGVEICGRRVTCGAQHALSLVPSRDGLKRRARANWQPLYINCELNDSEVWLKSALHYDPDKESMSFGQPVEKCYCLSVGKVSYGREAAESTILMAGPSGSVGGTGEAPPTHRLVVHDLRAAWTKPNRDVAFALFDTYMKNKQLKKNLSTEALKIFRSEDSESKVQNGRAPEPNTPATPPTNPVQSGVGQTQALLAQLVAEAEHKAVVFSDDLSESNTQPPPHAITAANDDSSICSWLIALVNPQVVLRGCETKGYVVLCAARAEVRQRIRRGRCTWSGSLQSMQYYATVSARDNEQLHQNIQWVCVEEIEDKGSRAISALPDVPRLVGSGHSAGGVLGSTVGPSVDQADAPQLQRIVSRCTCEFYYVSYEEIGGVVEGSGGGGWEEPDIPCDSFTLMHHDLDVCTNSLQYAMLLDVVNNLVLYVEPQRKRALERMARMRFQLQLHRVPDPRRPIQLLQNQVRGLVAQLRRLEKETYLVQRALTEGMDQQAELQELQKQIILCKDQLNRDGEELHAMVSCYQESRSSSVPATTNRPAAPVKVNEICFKHAQWRLTDADGQLGVADLVLTNFQYTKNTKSDDSVEHLLELGYVRMTNLLPNEPYSEVLLPSEVRSHMPVARQRVLRVFCREKPPVGGISVKEHFEINVVPITICLTKKFYNTMLKFCFPERDPETIEDRGEGVDDDDMSVVSGGSSNSLSKQDKEKVKAKSKGKKNHKDTNFYVKIDPKDDVEKMKERAEKNKLFIYIKIPEVPVRLSYKGNKEKNLEDLRDISIVIPTLEYHNVTWTWLDLLLAMKVDSRRVILSQAIRQKLNLHRARQVTVGVGGTIATPPEEDKARMLLGDRRPGDTKSHKKGVPGAFKFQK